jgi:hypothetical protein
MWATSEFQLAMAAWRSSTMEIAGDDMDGNTAWWEAAG